MDSTQVGAILAPVLAIIVSLVTYVLTNNRTQKLDDRSAAKETVDILATQNKVLLEDIKDLRSRIRSLEQAKSDCEERLAKFKTTNGLASTT